MSLQYLNDYESAPGSSHSAPILAVCWTASAIFSADKDGVIKAWQPSKGAPYSDLARPHSNAVACLSTNASSTHVLSSSIDGSIALWDASLFSASGQEQEQRTESLPDAEDIITIPCPEGVLLASHDSVADTKAGVSQAWITVLHPTKPLFASVGVGARVSVHSAEPRSFGKRIAVLDCPDSSEPFGTALAFNSDGSLLALATDDGQVFLYAAAGGSSSWRMITSYADHASPVRALSFAPNHHLLVGGDDRTITIHDIRAAGPDAERRVGGTVASLQGHAGWVMAVHASPVGEGRIIASSSMDHTIKLWDLAASPKSCVCTCTEAGQVWCFSWRPSPPVQDSVQDEVARITATPGLGQGSKFVTGGQDGRVRWYRSAGV